MNCVAIALHDGSNAPEGIEQLPDLREISSKSSWHQHSTMNNVIAIYKTISSLRTNSVTRKKFCILDERNTSSSGGNSWP
jgi:hypothetical protein